MLIYMIYDSGSDEDPCIKYAGTLKDAHEAAKVLVYARGVHVLHLKSREASPFRGRR